jgi:hypothetical protein
VIILTLAVSSLIMIKPASAQSIPKPSVPEFALEYVENPYDTQAGYHIENKSVEVTIKNQPFVTYLAADSHRQINLYYNISYKEHNEEQWSYCYDYFSASSSNYTIVTIGLGTMADRGTIGNLSGEADFRVQALVGYYSSREFLPDTYIYSFFGETSGWSNTQTLTIPDTSVSASPTTTPSVPEFQSLAIPLILIIMLAAGLVYFKKHKRAAVLPSS